MVIDSGPAALRQDADDPPPLRSQSWSELAANSGCAESMSAVALADPKMKVTTAPVSGGRLELHGRERYARVGLSVQAAGSRVTL